MLKSLYLILFILLLSGALKAQTGCIPSSNTSRIYTTFVSGTTYSKANFVTLTGGCSWNLTPGSPCIVGGGVGSGILGQSSPQVCPIDSYIPLLILLCNIGYFALAKIRKQMIHYS